jgi:hypothetical protein
MSRLGPIIPIRPFCGSPESNISLPVYLEALEYTAAGGKGSNKLVMIIERLTVLFSAARRSKHLFGLARYYLQARARLKK